MVQSIEEKVRNFITSAGGYAKADALRAEGIHSNQLSALVESGAVVRLKRGLYVLPGTGGRSELVDIQQAIPRGVFCLGTALSLHGMGTWVPAEYQLAVPRDYRVALPAYPAIKLYSFSGARFDLAIIEQSTEHGIIRVYSREKTICDIVRFRNSLGLDIVKEALHEYLKSPGRDIPRLLDYARLLRTEGTIRGYLELFA